MSEPAADAASDNVPAFGTADLTNCDREPIHIPACVQPHGALLTLDPRDLTILQAGGDTTRMFGAEPAALSGRNAGDLLPEAEVARLRGLIGDTGAPLRPTHVFTLAAAMDGRVLDVIVHDSGGTLVLEFEPQVDSGPQDALGLVQTMLMRVQEAATPRAFCQALADEARRITGFDRAVVYRFLPDGSGMVEAEARADDLEPFLGLHYPASDIPRQARDLYLRNWIRLIPQARYTPAPIVPALDPRDGRPLDLSCSVLRSVSPVHLEYLANMGVAASMSLSLIRDGRLWGLIACHHRVPRFLPHRLRMACELFAQMASSKLETKVAAEDFEAQLHAKRVHEELVTQMSREANLADGLTRFRPNLLDLIPADGVGLWLDGSYAEVGRTPNEAQIAGLTAWLNETVADGVFHTDRLPQLYPPAQAFADVASGLIALAVSREPRDYVLWFRPEMIHTVAWGGDPHKPVGSGRLADRLTPRGSFAVWREEVHQRSRPWRAVYVEAARALRLSLVEVIMRRMDQVAREQERARVRQEALTAELDRRLGELDIEAGRRAVAEAELSQVLRQTVTDQEAERERIARELHDSLGQALTLLQLGLDGLGHSVSANAEAQAQVLALKRLTHGVGKEINRLAWEIRPTALGDLGLRTAVRQLVETWSERSQLQFDLHVAPDDRRLDTAVETTLYRVLQEAITNVVRHAEASRVDVILETNDQEARLIVEDDGRGFAWNDAAPAIGPTKRLGLLGIRERLQLVGGTLEIESAPGRGTTLFIRVPL